MSVDHKLKKFLYREHIANILDFVTVILDKSIEDDM